MKRHVVVAITGASGAAYAVRLLEVLLAAGCDVHLTISNAAQVVMQQELNLTIDLEHFEAAALRLDDGSEPNDSKLRNVRAMAHDIDRSGDVAADDVATQQPIEQGRLHYHGNDDYMAPIASGSFLTDGMVICPCSASTLSAIAHGTSANLTHRAADVHLKERRKLILVPRETPLGLSQLDNMRRAAEAGAVILPAMPGFYHGAQSIGDLVDFIVSRICDQLGIANGLIQRWGS